MTLGTDPRSDPRMVRALRAVGLDGPAEPPPFGPEAGLGAMLELIAMIEAGVGPLFDTLNPDLDPITGVTHETIEIDGPDGNAIPLYVSRPAGTTGPPPCIVQLHGGGMVMLTAADTLYRRWRAELAAAGAVVVGVEFRNGAGALGPHPFPAGIEDCATALRWVDANRDALGVSGTTVVTGESGGANLALALAIKARREGWLEAIAGVHAQCPYLLGDWQNRPPGLDSLTEHDGYILDVSMFALLAEVYDPGRAHADDPTVWASRATLEDLDGLPPHVITVNEVDPLRDEGLAHHRRLLDAGVSSTCRLNVGLCHTGELLLPAAMPDVYASAVRDVAGFARSL